MSSRLSVNTNDATDAALRLIAAEDGVSVTEVVRRAVSVYKFMRDATEDGETEIQLHGSGPVRVVHLV